MTVVFFFGGQSSEHEISCMTAVGVLGALDPGRFVACGVGIARDGRWVRYGAADIATLVVTDDGQLPSVDAARPGAVLTRDGSHVYLSTLDGDRLIDTVRVDVAFPLLHGPFGEDGTIQGFFEMMGLPYAGAGVAASAIGMDKELSNLAFAQAGLGVGPYITLGGKNEAWAVDDAVGAIEEAGLEYPLYVKPARGGSSVGISRVEAEGALEAALTLARRHDHKVIIEQGIVGAREIECAVLGPRPGGGAVRASRPGEIVVHDVAGFYDYEAKYLAPDEADVVVPADLPPDVTDAVRRVAVTAFEAIGGEGLSRVDSFVLADGTVIVNEINTMPGFTQISAYPLMWQAEGMTYQALISDLIDQAIARRMGSR